MASTFTSNNGIEKPTQGDQIGSWGITADNNFDIIDEALDGVSQITLSGSTYALTFTNGVTPNIARSRVLVFNGTPGTAVTITISPDAGAFGQLHKFYIVVNNTNQDLKFQSSGGDTYTLTPARRSMIIYCDGSGNIEGLPAPSNGPTTVNITSTSTISVKDGQNALVLTGTPVNNPQTITLNTIPAQNASLGASVLPMVLWVVNQTSNALVLTSGTGNTTYTIGALSSTPIYVDGANDIYGALFGERTRAITLTNTTTSVPLIPELDAITFANAPAVTSAATVNLPGTVKTALWVINNCGQQITFQCASPGPSGSVVVANGNTVLLYTNGAGAITNLLGGTVQAGAISCTGLSASGTITTGAVTATGTVSAATSVTTGTAFAGNFSTAGIVIGASTGTGGNAFQIGDDLRLADVSIANTMGLLGVQDSTLGGLRFGSAGPILANSGTDLVLSYGNLHAAGNATVDGTVVTGAVLVTTNINAGAGIAAAGAITAGTTITTPTLTLNGVSCSATGQVSYTPAGGANTTTVQANTGYYRVLGPMVFFGFDIYVTPAATSGFMEVTLPLSYIADVPCPMTVGVGIGVPAAHPGPGLPVSGYLSQSSTRLILAANTLIHTSANWQSGTTYRICASGVYVRP